jgi:hypothetical protein
MNAPCRSPISLDELIAYERRELTAGDDARVEEHFFGCGSCSMRLASVSRLGASIKALVEHGSVASTVTARLVDQAAASGFHLRRYRLGPNDQVACTAAPEDDFVVTWLELEVADDEKVDVVSEIIDVASGASQTRVAQDVAVDRRAGAVVMLSPGGVIRALPRSRWIVRARATGPRGERWIGPYTFDHTPYHELAGSP